MPVSLIAHVSAPTPTTVSAAIDTSGADFLIALLGGFNSSASGVSDSKGNSWKLTRPRKSSSNGCEVAIFECVPTSVGSGHTFTPSGSFATMCVAAFAGVKRNYGDNNLTGTTIQPGTLSLPQRIGLVIAALSFEVAAVVSIDAPFTITDQVPFAGGTKFGSALAYAINPTGTINPTWTIASSGVCAAAIAAYGESGGGEVAATFVG